MKSFYMELYAYDAETNERIGKLTVSGKDNERRKVIMTVPENHKIYVSSHEIVELARLAEEALDI